jgi:hypothetical protein
MATEENTTQPLSNPAAGWAIGGEAVPTSSRIAALDADVRAYLESEAKRRNVSVEEVYRDEVAAQHELARITPRNADLLRIADRLPAPQTWYEE